MTIMTNQFPRTNGEQYDTGIPLLKEVLDEKI